MQVRDVMTRDVVSVAPTASVKQVIKALNQHRVRGVPVSDAGGRVLGMITETDLIAKLAYSALPAGDLALRWETGPSSEHAHHLTGAAALQAEQLMTTPAIFVCPDAEVGEAARNLADHEVNSAPVLDEGRLVGIVSRADLLRAYGRTDAQIAKEVMDALVAEGTGVHDGEAVEISVEQGVVTIDPGPLAAKVVECLRRAAYRVPGVVWVTIA